MNFIEAFEELNSLNEEVLTEKHWVVIQPKGSNTWYRFYTVNDKNKQNKDIADMLGDRNGTYKQTLDKGILADLKKELKIAMDNEKTSSLSDPANYVLKAPSEVGPEAELKTLTKADRALRQAAQAKYTTDMLEKNDKLKELMKNKKCLIHHINGHEDKTEPENVVLVPYSDNKDSLKVANGIHSVLHATADSRGIKMEPINWDTPLYWFDKAKGQWQIGSCNMVIDLSRAPEGYTQP